MRYSDIIFTNHAIERMGQRGLSYDYVKETVKNPDRSYGGKESGTTESIKQYGISKVTIITKRNQQNEIIVLSAWIDPPLAGTKDAKEKNLYNKSKKAGPWGKIWIAIRRQLGI